MNALRLLLLSPFDPRLVGLVFASAGLGAFFARSALSARGVAFGWRRFLWLLAGAAALGGVAWLVHRMLIWGIFPYLYAAGDPATDALALAIAGLSGLFALVVAMLGLTGVAIDYRLAHLARREQDRMRQMADSALEGILVARNGAILDANTAFCALVGDTMAGLRERRVAALFRSAPGEPGPWADLSLQPPRRQEAELRLADGSYVPVEVLSRTVQYKDGPYRDRPAQVLAVRDIRERRSAESRIRHLAHHDGLTNLVNRTMLRQRMEQALAASVTSGQEVAVLCLDLDRFKAVNDAYGHKTGDLLLGQVAQRLRELVDPLHTVARIGGDEFVVLQNSGSQPQTAVTLSDRITATLSVPFNLDNTIVQIGVSIGIAIFPRDGLDPDALLHNADLALYRAKSDGKGVSCTFEADMDVKLRDRQRLEQDLRHSIGSAEFELHYQPQYETQFSRRSLTLVGFEALLRWNHPVRGLVSPADFVPVAEATGLIVPLGLWALETACREAMNWPAACTVAVNLSPIQFRGYDLAATIDRILQTTGLAPHRLDLEVSESLLVQDSNHTLHTLQAIKALGVRITLDGFGTGLSNLSSLQRFPLDKLKIDHSFIEALGSSPAAAAIVEAILALSRSLGLAVTAEGVETEDQLRLLQEMSCGTVQGYLLGRPVPAQSVIRHLDPTEAAA